MCKAIYVVIFTALALIYAVNSHCGAHKVEHWKKCTNSGVFKVKPACLKLEPDCFWKDYGFCGAHKVEHHKKCTNPSVFPHEAKCKALAPDCFWKELEDKAPKGEMGESFHLHMGGGEGEGPKFTGNKKCLDFVGPSAKHIGQGISGAVYTTDGETAIKTFGDAVQCKPRTGQGELAAQHHIYDLFHNFLYNWKVPRVAAEMKNTVGHSLMIAHPGMFCKGEPEGYKFDIGTKPHRNMVVCFYTMGILQSIPHSTWTKILPEVPVGMGGDKHVQFHLSFAREDAAHYDTAEHGYVLTLSDWKANWRGKEKIPFNAKQLLQLFGFANGLISVGLQSRARDIEFALALYGPHWKVNMMDFGGVRKVTTKYNSQTEMVGSCEHGQAAKASSVEYQSGWDLAAYTVFWNWCVSQKAKISKSVVEAKANGLLRAGDEHIGTKLESCLESLDSRKLLSAAHGMYRNEYHYGSDVDYDGYEAYVGYGIRKPAEESTLIGLIFIGFTFVMIVLCAIGCICLVFVVAVAALYHQNMLNKKESNYTQSNVDASTV